MIEILYKKLIIAVLVSCLGHLVLGRISNQGQDFCVGFMKNPYINSVPSLSFNVLVGTNSSSSVSFTVEYPSEQNNIVHHQTSRNSPYRLKFTVFDASVSVDSGSFVDRNKGICVSTDESTELFLIVYLWLNPVTIASYLALPYQEILTDQYEYYILSTVSSDKTKQSGFLLVGLRDNTSISIYPSIPLNITEDTQNETSNNLEVLPGQSHTVILHRRQTLYIGKDGGADVTGTRIVSDKPLTVMSGHEAGSVPNDGTLEPMAQQIPPTQLWGQRFMIVPLLGHTLGQMIKVLSSADNTEVSYNCYKFSNRTLLAAGGIHEFFVSFDEYCYIEANSSVLVGQFPYSPKGNSDGDTTMILVASVDQYSNNFTFWTLNKTNGNAKITHYINIIVPVQYYSNGTDVIYDGSIIESEWKPILDIRNKTVGYRYRAKVSEGKHQVSHTDPAGRLSIMVYGFTTGHAYGYTAGIQFSPNRALGINFSSEEYTVSEGSGTIDIEIYRHTQINFIESFHITTKHSTSSPGNNYVVSDYVPISKDLVFSPMESSISVPITIIDDGLVESNKSFIVQLCHTSHPLNDVCIQSKVTIVDDDVVLTVGITEVDYDYNSQNLTITVKLLKGKLSPEESVTINISIILVTEANHSIWDTTMLTSVHMTVLKEYNVGIISEVDMETLIYIQLSVNEKKHQVVNTNPRNYTVVLQGRVPSTTTVYTTHDQDNKGSTATQISTTSTLGNLNISTSVHGTTRGLTVTTLRTTEKVTASAVHSIFGMSLSVPAITWASSSAVTTLRTTEKTKASTFVIFSTIPIISGVSPNNQGKYNLFVILIVVLVLKIGILIGVVIGCAFCYVQRRIRKPEEFQFFKLNNKGHGNITNDLSEATFLVKDKGDIDGDENEDSSSTKQRM